MTRWGILSTAHINLKLLAGAAKSDDAEVVAVASRDQARAEAYAREHGIPRAFGSYDALLADPDVEAVYISLPNGLHCEWSIRALEAGKHVLCEKPMSASPAEVEAVFDAAEANGRLCMEAFMWRHTPQTRALEALVADGAIGELRIVRSAFTFNMTDHAVNVRLREDLAGGALMDLGCYCVSASRMLAGEPLAATGQRVLGASGVDVRMAATLSFPGDVLAHLHCSFDLPDFSALELFGSEGSIRVSDPWHGRLPGLSLQRGDEIELIEIEPENPYRLELDNLGSAIRGERTQLLGREDAVGQARTLEAIYAAADAAG
jgi:D-xylose 1-dehydrogenase (NADP+, D-xylono-1,5-lactone-forming)